MLGRFRIPLRAHRHRMLALGNAVDTQDVAGLGLRILGLGRATGASVNHHDSPDGDRADLQPAQRALETELLADGRAEADRHFAFDRAEVVHLGTDLVGSRREIGDLHGTLAAELAVQVEARAFRHGRDRDRTGNALHLHEEVLAVASRERKLARLVLVTRAPQRHGRTPLRDVTDRQRRLAARNAVHDHFRVGRIRRDLHDARVQDQDFMLDERRAPDRLHLERARLETGLLQQQTIGGAGLQLRQKPRRFAQGASVQGNVAPGRLGRDEHQAPDRRQHGVLGEIGALGQIEELIFGIVVLQLETDVMGRARLQVEERQRRDAARRTVDNDTRAAR